MNNILILVEKKDGKYFDLPKVLRNNIVSINREIYIVFFGSTDGEIIEKKCIGFPEVKKIDIEKVVLDKKQIDFINKEAQKITDDYFEVLEEDLIKDTRKTLYGNIYNVVEVSIILKEKLLNMVEKGNFNEYILIGKKNSNTFEENGFNFLKKIEYFGALSAWTRIIIKGQKKIITIYKTDNFFKKKFSAILKNIAFFIGYIKIIFSYYLVISNKNVEESKNVTVLLRGKVHVNLAARLLEGDNRNIGIIFDSNKIPIEYLEKYFPKRLKECKPKRIISLKIIIGFIVSFFRHLKIISKFKKKSRIKGFDVNFEISNCILTYPVILSLREYVNVNKVEEYITFEETNLFGAIFSQAIVPNVKRSCCVQHGFTVSYYKTMPLISKERWVWGEYFKQQYILRGEDEKRLKSKGNYLLNWRKYEGTESYQELRILLSPAYSSDIMFIEQWISSVLKSLQKIDTREVIISIHPSNKNLARQLETNIQTNNLLIKIITACSNKDILNSDIVISGNTTVGFEAALLGKLVFYYSLNGMKIIYEYVLHPYIYIYGEEDDLSKILNEYNNKEKYQNHLNFLKKYAGMNGRLDGK